MMTIESAAREAADFGAWRSANWAGDLADDASARYKTEAGMKERACTASSSLWGSENPSGDCSGNPRIEIDLLDENFHSVLDGARALKASSKCEDPARASGPCNVKVTMTYEFDLILPVGIDFGGTRLGLPQDVELTRESIFAISDFTADS